MSEKYNVSFLVITESTSLKEISTHLKRRPHKDSVEKGDRLPFYVIGRPRKRFDKTVWRLESGIGGMASPRAHFRALVKKLDLKFRERLATLKIPHELVISVGVFRHEEMKMLNIDHATIEAFSTIPCRFEIAVYS